MKLIISALLISISICQGANILGIFHHPGKSHHTLGEVLLKALAEKGHTVTMVSPYPLKDKFKNYKDIVTHETMKDMNERVENSWFQRFSKNSVSTSTFSMLLNMTTAQSELLFQNKEFMNLIKTGEKFDLIIMDWLFNESHLVFGNIFDCPIIPIASAGTSVHVNYLVGNTGPWSYVPYKYFSLTDRMNFFDRVLNVAVNSAIYYYTYFQQRDHQNIVDKYLPGQPLLDDLIERVAVVLSNTHYSFETVRPFVPNLIEVGGFHVEKTKPLPNDLKKYLDEAKDGFIYFSLGSNMKGIFLDENRRKGILKALGKVPIKILWKFESEIEDLPKNIKTGKWLPQTDILGHPNIKLFITHGGLLSTIESVHHGVPMIGIPMFGDQNSNVPTAVEKGYSLQIKRNDLSEQSLYTAIMEMLGNNKYKEAALLHSDLLRNQPIKPLDKALYWVEHVLKHKGADHLKNTSNKLYWFQNLLLDVIAFLIVTLSIILFVSFAITKYVLCKLIRLVRRCKKESTKNKNQKSNKTKSKRA